MLFLHSTVTTIGLGLSLFAASCQGGFHATPTSLSGWCHVNQRLGHHLSQPQPILCSPRIVGSFIDDTGKVTSLIDINCDQRPDYAQCGNRRWEIRPNGPQALPHGPTPWYHQQQPIRYSEPQFGNRTAAEWIVATGLDALESPGLFAQDFWLHEIDTVEWLLDITIPSTSDCHRPRFADYDLGYQWNVIPGDSGPEFETWRVRGDLNEVLRFLVDCGADNMTMETKAGTLVIEVVDDGAAVVAMLDGVQQYRVDLD
ncbi:MAG: hypothetical protein MK116_03625 [Phycisphaerales bacterium]|nr:hypothetical protein [Phycisphaerales bacterium]